jgi:hypothetical protein
MVRLLSTFCAASLIAVTPVGGQQTQFSFRPQTAGGWLVRAYQDDCAMLYDVVKGGPDERVTFDFIYSPDGEDSAIIMSSATWQSLRTRAARNERKISASYHFDGDTSVTSGTAHIFAGSRADPMIFLSRDKRSTAALLETLRASETMTATIGGRSLGPYDLGTISDGLDLLMECVAAAREVMSKDPFR